jgi:hypothetical protein
MKFLLQFERSTKQFYLYKSAEPGVIAQIYIPKIKLQVPSAFLELEVVPSATAVKVNNIEAPPHA